MKGKSVLDNANSRVQHDDPESSTRFSTFALLSQEQSLRPLLVLACSSIGSQLDALVDSGATHNFRSLTCFEVLRRYEKHKLEQELLVEERGKLHVTLADGSVMESRCVVRMPIKIDKG